MDSINVFDTKGKEVRNCILNLESKELFPLKVILPQIDESLTNRDRCLDLGELEYLVDSFGNQKE